MHISKCLVGIGIALGSVIPAHGMPDYQNAVFIMNEGAWGTNGSINIFTPDGPWEWSYRKFRQVNAGKEIPGAICHAHFHAGHLFVVSNHLLEGGETAGTLTVCDAADLSWKQSIELTNRHGKTVQGRAAFALDDDRVIISTSDGLLEYSVGENAITGEHEEFSSPDGNASPVPFQYPYQTGSIVRAGDYLYVASQSFGLIRIPTGDDGHSGRFTLADLFHGELPGCLSSDNGIGSVVLGSDGNLWLSVTSDTNATGAAARAIVKFDPYKWEAEAIEVPEGIYPPANSWYAWNPDGFHASPVAKKLYWNGGADTWFSNSAVFAYDIEAATFSKVLDLAEENAQEGTDWKIYGCSMRTSPVNGEMYLSLFKDYASTDYTLRRLASDGSKISDYAMEPDFWFPSLPVFFDYHKPEFAPMEEIELPVDVATTIDLMGKATDADGQDAAITYSLKAVSHQWPDYEVRCDGRFVTIYPHGVEAPPECDGAPSSASPQNEGDYEYPEECWIDLLADSQGFQAGSRLKFRFMTASVDEIGAASKDTQASVSGSLLTLRNDSGEVLQGVIYTPQGSVAKVVEAPTGESVHSLSDLPAGLYIVRLGSSTLKFRL